jgi:hypothetical protein
MTGLLTENIYGDDEEDATVHCHECDVIATSREEGIANGFCHVKVFDARRRVVVGGSDEDQQEAADRLIDDGYYWLCPNCFHQMRQTLLVLGRSGDV